MSHKPATCMQHIQPNEATGTILAQVCEAAEYTNTTRHLTVASDKCQEKSSIPLASPCLPHDWQLEAGLD